VTINLKLQIGYCCIRGVEAINCNAPEKAGKVIFKDSPLLPDKDIQQYPACLQQPLSLNITMANMKDP